MNQFHNHIADDTPARSFNPINALRAFKPPIPAKQKSFVAPLIQPEAWEPLFTEFEEYFSSIELPAEPIKLSGCETITNVKTFIETHLETLKASSGKRTFLPYLRRLKELKNLLTIKINHNENETANHGTV